MKILHLNKNKKWVAVGKKNYNDEAHLQDLLADDVNILPLDEIGYDTKFVTIGKEVSLQNGYLDILAVSAQGHIALIETKLSKNPEVKRTVVGQILGYAAYFWNKSYKDMEIDCFRKYITQRKISFDGNLLEYMKEKLGEDNFSEAEFKEGLEKRLRLGSFTLLIVVDEANQELKDIANYLNDRTGQEVDFYVVEMELIGDSDEQFLIPHLSNPPRKNIVFPSEKSKSTNAYDRTPMTRDELIPQLSDSSRRLATELLNKYEASSSADVKWGTTGFSIRKQISSSFDSGERCQSFSFLFLGTGKVGSGGDISFWYPEDTYEQHDELKPSTTDYVTYYRSLPGYDEKRKVIKDLSVFTGEEIDRFIELIEKTIELLEDKDGEI